MISLDATIEKSKDKNDKLFWALNEEYEEKFGEGFCIPAPAGFCPNEKSRYGIDEKNFDDVEVGILIMRECLRIGKPFEPSELPEGCIA